MQAPTFSIYQRGHADQVRAEPRPEGPGGSESEQWRCEVGRWDESGSKGQASGAWLGGTRGQEEAVEMGVNE